MRPNDPLATLRTGLPKFGWLNTSNISLRNWRLNFSVSLVFFVTEKSVLRNPGPLIASRPRVPGWQVGSVAGGTGATQGETKTALFANHCAGSPVVCTVPFRSGRTVREIPTPGPIAIVGFRGL